MKPLAIDLYAGLGGWSSALLAEGYEVVGFDIEQHVYGEHRYPAQLVMQDVRSIHGRQFKGAALIVASPPCQEFSYMAMPWTRAKQIRRALRGEGDFPDGYRGSRTVADLTALFDACFRIQAEASEAAGHHIPLVVENVRGAQEWVGRARWRFGSFYLWGDVPALMPMTGRAAKVQGFRFDGSGRSFQSASVEHVKVGGLDWKPPHDPRHRKGQAFNTTAERATKNAGGSWFRVSHNNVPHSRGGVVKHTPHMTNPGEHAGIKQGGTWFHDANSASRTSSSKSPARKMASAMIAKIPEPLARHIARVYRP